MDPPLMMRSRRPIQRTATQGRQEGFDHVASLALAANKDMGLGVIADHRTKSMSSWLRLAGSVCSRRAGGMGSCRTFSSSCRNTRTSFRAWLTYHAVVWDRGNMSILV